MGVDMNKVEMDRDIFFQEVKQTAFFSCMEDADLMQIIDFSEILSYERGESIITEGTENNGFFVLLSGKLEIVKSGKWGDVKIGILQNNASFGETSLFKRLRSFDNPAYI